MLKNTIKQYCYGNQRRYLWHWVNKMFNDVDPERVKSVGPNKACAEWLLRNGGSVSWKSGKTTTDYNLLPGSVEKLVAIDGSNSSISHYGFAHLRGCKDVEKIILHKCNYIEDKAIEALSFCESPLKFLQITKCPNITDDGLKKFPQLDSLETLVLDDLIEVKDMAACKKFIKEKLPKCDIQPESKQ